MTQQALNCLYSRYHALLDELDEKASLIESWQSAELHRLAEEAERVLQGCRRLSERRS